MLNGGEFPAGDRVTAFALADLPARPDIALSAKTLFGLSQEREVWGFGRRTAWVPPVDPAYRFDPATTLAILAGFQENRRVIIQGMHGTGKSTHIEQVAARLNWPCVRVNLDSHISRIDLVGKDAIVLRDGKQVTEYREGILPWAFQRPVALVFDEYDAGRPDVMFVIQRVLEAEGRLTILDQNRVLDAHPSFRLFATANTIGLGDTSGLYHGTQQINQGQMDRWNVVTRLDYLAHDVEVEIVAARVQAFAEDSSKALLNRMVRLADLTRHGFRAGDVSTLMSPRTVINWAENTRIFASVPFAFLVTFLNKCDETERPIFAEYYQRAMGEALPVDPDAALARQDTSATSFPYPGGLAR
jgi:cobaltochelatase CobS